jgi:arylsulfatase A-like enzyme
MSTRLIFLTLLTIVFAARPATAAPPNVVLIITDDQGYGDLGCHGNTMIQTPNLDRLAKQSVRLTNFHVDPTCAETRSALMTGRYSCRTGVWHTVAGRSILRRDETTMAECFQHSGYKTGLFGKWHLGDHWPYRPQDRGFDEVLRLGCGGVGQMSDAWGNDYFDDTYEHNGKLEPQQGYCTDVFFAAATKFIEQHRQEPFFCYVATNAPHDPLNVEERYSKPYLDQGVPPLMSRFYGMITNIDENVGQLLAKLDEWKLTDNTIVIFMTDNGSGDGTAPRRPAPDAKWQGFRAGMRGMKVSEYDGGHRVPCFIRWPGGKLQHGSEVASLAAHFDLLPTLRDLCNLESPRAVKYDGRSLKPLLTEKDAKWEPRTLVVHSQRMEMPQKWHKTAVMTDRWRLVDRTELYDMQADGAQTKNVAKDHPVIMEELSRFYDQWWDDVSLRFDELPWIPLGNDKAPVVNLNCHDWHGQAIAYQSQLDNTPPANGWWAVDVEQPGKYRITLRERPAGVQHKLTATKARVSCGGVQSEIDVPKDAGELPVEMDLPKGQTKLQTTLTDAAGKSHGAYFVTVERVK